MDSGTWTTDVTAGYRTKIIRHGNCTITINRPMLSAEQQARRETDALHSVARVLLEMERRINKK